MIAYYLEDWRVFLFHFVCFKGSFITTTSTTLFCQTVLEYTFGIFWSLAAAVCFSLSITLCIIWVQFWLRQTGDLSFYLLPLLLETEWATFYMVLPDWWKSDWVSEWVCILVETALGWLFFLCLSILLFCVTILV